MMGLDTNFLFLKWLNIAPKKVLIVMKYLLALLKNILILWAEEQAGPLAPNNDISFPDISWPQEYRWSAKARA